MVRIVLLFFLALFSLSVRAAESLPSSGGSDPSAPPLNPGQSYLEPLARHSEKPALRVRSDFYSRYMWNGIPYSTGAVWQPSATLEFQGIGFTLWANFVLGNEPNQGEHNEVDFTLYYRRSIKDLDIQFSFITAVYFNEEPGSLNRGPNALEGTLRLDYPLVPVGVFTDLFVGFLQPSGTLFWDFGVSYQRNLPLHFSLETSALFGIGSARFNRAFIANVGTQPNLFEFSLAFPWAPIKRLSFTPSMTVTVLLAPSLRDASRDPTLVWGGLSIAYQID